MSQAKKELKLLKFINDFIQISPTREQKQIVRAIEDNQKVLIVAGNGFGKSFIVAMTKLALLLTVPDSKVIGTSGSYSQYRDSVWSPMAEEFEELKERANVPGKVLDYRNMLKIDRNWYAKIVSPSDPGDLEGRHASRVMVVIEEADKKYITEEHFDSAFSSVTDQEDRFIAIANPPDEQVGPVWERMRSDEWYTLQFTSFENRNVRMRRKEVEGLLTLDQIRHDYRNWNARDWPGIEKAKEPAEIVRKTYDPEYELSDDEKQRLEGLEERWYRRRLGVIPPASSSVHRPIHTPTIRGAYRHSIDFTDYTPRTFGMDVARSGGDDNVIISFSGPLGHYKVEDRWSGLDHVRNKERAAQTFDDHRKADIAIDATGEGSGLADELCDEYPNAFRFKANNNAHQEMKYKDRWAEGLNELGDALDIGATFTGTRFKEELMRAASVIQFEERHYKSREADTVLKATPKSDVKDELGRSPDMLDAAMMASWAFQFDPVQVPESMTWGS